MTKRRSETNTASGNSNLSTRQSLRSAPYPFAAIVGQDEMRLALILNVVDPLIGGVLIMGHRGTGKSTAVRALADLLPHVQVVSDCPYGCDPKDEGHLCAECAEKTALGMKLTSHSATVAVVELPLGATEDRVCGTIDIERALNEGRKVFEPGLLARANRGFLYIDEVNLLEDHLVDLLLDVAATGWNKVERESVSVEHPARFVLIGSGNPEEGELRPQLLDRFGLQVEVATENDLEHRVAILERREGYDRDPESFRSSFASQTEQLRRQMTKARASFTKVKVERELLRNIARLCADLKVDGHRGELTIMRAARALAAFESRKRVTEGDVKRVAGMALRHRLRRDVLEETASSDRIDQALKALIPDTPTLAKAADRSVDNVISKGGQGQNGDPEKVDRDARYRSGLPSAFDDVSAELPSPPAIANGSITDELNHTGPQTGHQRRSHSRRGKSPRGSSAAGKLRGRYTRAVNFKTVGSIIALDATLRALACSGASARGNSKGALTPIVPYALRYKLFKHKQGCLYVFAIDTSGSMAAQRIARAKGAILTLLRQSYLNRDHVAIVTFRGKGASVSLEPSRSILRAGRVLESLHMGGGTPLAAGLTCTIDLLRRVRDKHGDAVVLLFTDGHANVLLGKNGTQTIENEVELLSAEMNKIGAGVVVVDTQRGFESTHETEQLARVLHARFVKLGAL